MFTSNVAKKIILLTLGLFTIIFIFTACSANIALNIEPDPIVFTEDDTTETITISLRTSGVGNVRVDELILLVYDEDEQEVYEGKIEVYEEFPVVPGISLKREYVLDVCDIIENIENTDEEIDEEKCQEIYKEQLAGSEYELKILLQGSITSTAVADIIFE